MKKLKFLITVPAYYPGPDVSCVSDLINSFATGLSQRGYEVHIMHSLDASASGLSSCSASWKKLVAEWETRYPGLFIHTIKSPLKTADSFMAYLFGGSPYVNKCFSNLVKSIKPDVVHHHAPMFFGHQILRKRDYYLSVYTAHDYWFICQRAYLLKDGQKPCLSKDGCFSCAIRSKKPPQFGRLSKGFKRAINDVDLILTPSICVKETLSTELDVRIECIPHYVPYPKNVVQNSGYSNFFLYAGALGIHKGILTLLESFRRYADNIDGNLLLVGKGPLENYIQKFIVKHNLENKVILLGWVDKEFLWSLYRDASALIVPSLNQDPAPTVVMEALSVGTPVIGSDQGGIPDMIRKLDEKLIFRSGDTKSLGRILTCFNPELYPSHRVKDVCMKNFSVDTYILRYLALIENSITVRHNNDSYSDVCLKSAITH